MAIATLEGELVYLNQAGREIFGLGPASSVKERRLSDLQPDWAWQVVQAEGLPLARAYGTWAGETAARTGSGGEIPVAQRLLISGERIACLMRDLSEAKRRDVDRLETINRYETAIRLSGHALLDWDPFSSQLNCSGDLQAVLGRDATELGGNFGALRALVHPEDVAQFDDEIRRTVTTRNSLSVNFRLRHRDGGYRHLRAAGGFYLNREGRFGHITALLTNIDFVRHAREEVERLQAQMNLGVEEQVRQARAEAEQARQAKSEFLSRMSHELRTPLNAILGFTQLLELEESTPSQRESIDHIARAGQHLLSLINEVLDLSRMETGRLSLNLMAVPLEVIWQDAAAVLRPLAVERQIALEIAEPPPPPEARVLADQQRLQQVLLNLLTNAAKGTSPGSPMELRWAIAARERVRLSVNVTGDAISPEKLERLFTPMVRDLRLGQEKSGGELGLAVSRGIMRAMGGELGVESVMSLGNTFWVELPLTTALEPHEESAAPRLYEVEPAAAGATTERVHTILYVEDEEMNRTLMERVMTDYAEFQLLTASEGLLALDLARVQRPDLILLDLNLPDISGEVVLARLQDDTATAGIPVIMVTADVMGHRLERLLESGASGYLSKPFRITDLVQVIRETIAKHAKP